MLSEQGRSPINHDLFTVNAVDLVHFGPNAGFRCSALAIGGADTLPGFGS